MNTDVGVPLLYHLVFIRRPSCEAASGHRVKIVLVAQEKLCHPCHLLLIKTLSLVAKRSSLIEYSRVVNIILLNIKSLFYQHLYAFDYYLSAVYLRRRQFFYFLRAELKKF